MKWHDNSAALGEAREALSASDRLALTRRSSSASQEAVRASQRRLREAEEQCGTDTLTQAVVGVSSCPKSHVCL